MEKRNYAKPSMMVEVFMPQNYCDACFTYTASLRCIYGAGQATPPDGNEHGEPCANSTVTVTVNNGTVTMAGHEGGSKQAVQLTSVNIPGITDVHAVGDRLTNCSWSSLYGGITYQHLGNGTVTSWEMTKRGYPNHS